MTRNEKLLPWLESRPDGATFKEINAFLGESHRMTRKRMQQLRLIGAIEHTNKNPRFLRWHTPEHAVTAAKCCSEIRAKRKRRAIAVRKKRNRVRMSGYRVEKWIAEPPVQTLIPANEAPPIRVRAAASVWEWRP